MIGRHAAQIVIRLSHEGIGQYLAVTHIAAQRAHGTLGLLSGGKAAFGRAAAEYAGLYGIVSVKSRHFLGHVAVMDHVASP